MSVLHRTLMLTGALGAIVLACYTGCSAGGEEASGKGDSANSGGSGGTGGLFSTGGQGGLGIGGALTCENLECQIPDCGAGVTTKLTGVVYAPTPPQYGAADPLYNVIVYVPNAPLDPFPEGASCDKCGTPVSGKPISITLSNAKGEFELSDVPAGNNIPLVVQVGKWRRQVTIPNVAACQTTPLPPDLTRLPRNTQEGSIPKIAIASSVYDAEECILRKIGVDDMEFSGAGGPGRIHIYQGNGATIPGTQPMSALWASVSTLMQYDMALFPCSSVASGDQTAMQNVHDYADAGGRVFATDLSYPWFKSGPADFQSTAQWTTWGGTGVNPLPSLVDQTFPKGQALAEWLFNIGATPTMGSIDLYQTYHVVDGVNPPTVRWLYSTSPATVQTLSFNTPVGALPENQCGRAVYSNFHIANGSGSGTFPQECTPDPLTPQEKVLEFLLFDLASCVQDDQDDPIPPPE